MPIFVVRETPSTLTIPSTEHGPLFWKKTVCWSSFTHEAETMRTPSLWSSGMFVGHHAYVGTVRAVSVGGVGTRCCLSGLTSKISPREVKKGGGDELTRTVRPGRVFPKKANHLKSITSFWESLTHWVLATQSRPGSTASG